MRGPDPQRVSLARKLRRDQTSAEQRLWRAIRDRQLGGLKFMRQAAVEALDAVCEAVLAEAAAIAFPREPPS